MLGDTEQTGVWAQENALISPISTTGISSKDERSFFLVPVYWKEAGMSTLG